MTDLKLNRIIKTEIEVSVGDVANLFCRMNGDQQAEFFNLIALESNEWERPSVYQWQYITDSLILTEDGRRIMKEIGDYAYQTPK